MSDEAGNGEQLRAEKASTSNDAAQKFVDAYKKRPIEERLAEYEKVWRKLKNAKSVEGKGRYD